MKRSELAHILRSACKITGDPDILVIGSQSILGKYSHVALPDEAWMSVEADIAFFDDPDEKKADLVDGAIGEASPFHEFVWGIRPGRHARYGDASGRVAGASRSLHSR